MSKTRDTSSGGKEGEGGRVERVTPTLGKAELTAFIFSVKGKSCPKGSRLGEQEEKNKSPEIVTWEKHRVGNFF